MITYAQIHFNNSVYKLLGVVCTFQRSILQSRTLRIMKSFALGVLITLLSCLTGNVSSRPPEYEGLIAYCPEHYYRFCNGTEYDDYTTCLRKLSRSDKTCKGAFLVRHQLLLAAKVWQANHWKQFSFKCSE